MVKEQHKRNMCRACIFFKVSEEELDFSYKGFGAYIAFMQCHFNSTTELGCGEIYCSYGEIVLVPSLHGFCQ